MGMRIDILRDEFVPVLEVVDFSLNGRLDRKGEGHSV
jgi:hypothetical protein